MININAVISGELQHCSVIKECLQLPCYWFYEDTVVVIKMGGGGGLRMRAVCVCAHACTCTRARMCV